LLCLKKELEKTKLERLKIIDECKLHGGHITLDSLYHVNKLREKQLLAEIKFLRCTMVVEPTIS